MGDMSGGRPPGGGKKADRGGGIWGFVSNIFKNASFDVNIGGAPARPVNGNPTDPAARMTPVKEDRRETYDEMTYRTTDGEEGQAPAVRLNRERQHIARSIDNRSGGGGAAQAPIPEGGGQPLSKDVRARMEPRLGGDLGGVRVHTSGQSARAAEGMSAKAFTVGDDVHFGSGNYQPGTKEGDRLIAHELTHVVQGQKSGVQRKAKEDDAGGEGESAAGEVSHPDEPAEKEADHVGDHVADELHADQKADGKKESAAGSPHGATKGEQTGTQPKEQPKPISAKFIGHGHKIHRSALSPGIAASSSPGRKVMLAGKQSAAASAAPKPPGPGAGKVNLATACKSDPVANHKYNDVMSEAQPRAAAMKAKFVADATKALESMPNQPLQAMRSVVRGGGYFFLGNEIPPKAIADANGVSRVVDLPSIYNYYLDPSYKQRFQSVDMFCGAAAKGQFDPVKHIDDRKSMLGSGGVKETWWFPSSEANAVDLDGLREQLYIKDNPSYEKGAVRCDMVPEAVQQIGMKMYKPTAFDGMMQGWGNDPWWVTKPGTWGVTKNDTHEAVTKSKQWRFYKSRNLIKPAMPAGADAGVANASSSAGAGNKKPGKTK